MTYEQDFITKYFELLTSIDYNSNFSKELQQIDKDITDFDSLCKDFLNNQPTDKLILIIIQALKRDMSKGIGLFEEDELWDPLNKWADSQRRAYFEK